MSTTSTALNVGASSTINSAQSFKTYRLETKYEFLHLLRAKSFSLAVIGFPLMFYVLFGLPNKHVVEGGVNITKYMLGGYACFGLIGAALFGIGVGLASELNSGWLELKRASPMPVMAYLFAKCASAMAFGVIIVSILTGIGVAFGGVSITAIELAKMLGVTLAGSVSFASMGLLLALLMPANAAPGLVNLIYLPMSYLSGLWMPIKYMPHWLQHLAPVMPMYHLAQLMLSVYGYQQPGSSLMTHWNSLAGFTLVMLGLFWLVFQRKERNA
ncbi:ABC-2 type transport system permease protein [Granulicella aggregans]|uniref:Transport permease protein n=1 Tax=Granulicella aggregans TaxID=474949 RepID=A0A7W7ZEB8_9BACT|nr:ABC transporter permease [Granulicella aggregans]MBB5058298.1 ABC-2 type transport system permease protein [Granulicella aggregans]